MKGPHKAQVQKVKNNLSWKDALDPALVFVDINEKYTKLGALVKGIRYAVSRQKRRKKLLRM